MTCTHKQLAQMVKQVNPNKKTLGQSSRYVIPDLFKEGLNKLSKIQIDNMGNVSVAAGQVKTRLTRVNL